MENKKPWEAEIIDQPAQRDLKGRFVPGSKLMGRPAGVPNATTKEVRQIWANVVQDHLPQVYEDLARMTPEKRIHALVAVSQLILPRMSAIAIETFEGETTAVKQVFKIGDVEIEF